MQFGPDCIHFLTDDPPTCPDRTMVLFGPQSLPVRKDQPLLWALEDAYAHIAGGLFENTQPRLHQDHLRESELSRLDPNHSQRTAWSAHPDDRAVLDARFAHYSTLGSPRAGEVSLREPSAAQSGPAQRG